ncbi:MAG: TrmH family RNA methyltransferase [Bacteroidales bacterium]
MNTNNRELIEYLHTFISESRSEQLIENIKYRTRYISVVLENIYQTQNASAVLRTCDCFGVQDVHIIENEHDFELNPKVVRGASKWLSLHRYNENTNNTFEALSKLKKNGYRIVVTSPHAKQCNFDTFDLEKAKCAFVFGTEMHGVSDTAKELADEYFYIPMVGFTESLNISVSAAVIINHFTRELRKLGIGVLSDSEKEEIELDWLNKSIKSYDLIVKEYQARIQDVRP